MATSTLAEGTIAVDANEANEDAAEANSSNTPPAQQQEQRQRRPERVKCRLCSDYYPLATELRHHIATKHVSYHAHVCTECRLATTDMNEMSMHADLTEHRVTLNQVGVAIHYSHCLTNPIPIQEVDPFKRDLVERIFVESMQQHRIKNEPREPTPTVIPITIGTNTAGTRADRARELQHIKQEQSTALNLPASSSDRRRSVSRRRLPADYTGPTTIVSCLCAVK